MKVKDEVTTRVLRTTIAAIGNAEAVGLAPDQASRTAPALGVGSTDVARRALTTDQLVEIIRTEARELDSAAVEYVRLGHLERARTLEMEVAVLLTFLRNGAW
jgi:uncharacterized protein